ncbi:hypothetical protein K443DRAFT_507914 [Laccaria amethystina LaAM-08-1]|uniref:Uncharacterized protein n=1 Tax=Laccaria amethystina LaAM-08-1 TaxID=1095629 RepID=A0A0C9XYM1_9AGAR|nr:hypothetical protein K443DRAFT_507914 [Laccaria amethystina LaAM-08-1]
MSRDRQKFLLTSLVPPPKKKLNSARRRLPSRSSRVCAIVEEFQFDFGVGLGLEEGEESDVVLQCLGQSFSVRWHCESTLTRKDLRGGNIICYTMVTLSHPRYFQPKAIRLRRWSTFESHEKTANRGNWLSA